MIKSNCQYRFTATTEGLVVSVSGEIDHHSALSMRRDVDNIIWNRTPTHLILDMSEVNFMDSSGLGLIMGRMKSAEEIGCGFALKNPGERIKRLLDLAGADRIFDITEEKASKGEKK